MKIRYILENGNVFTIFDKDINRCRTINTKTGDAEDIHDERIMKMVEEKGELVWGKDYMLPAHLTLVESMFQRNSLSFV